MARVSLLGFVVFVAAEALAVSTPREAAFSEAELLSGGALTFLTTATLPAIPSRDEAFGLDRQMLEFVAALDAIHKPAQRLAALVRGMEQRGLFSLEYAEITRTASATFHDRQGNCLSFTMLFVGLARAAGLAVSYQNVDVPPTWSNDGQVVIANHVNAVVRTAFGDETIVDFNIREYEGRQTSRRVSDDYALALFYTNVGAEALLRQEYAASLAYLRAAARAHADLPAIWVNLGVLYARHGHYDYAEAAYLRALATDPSEESALANLVLVYQALDEPELAEQYRRRVQQYRERNPYYHYALARSAYDDGRPADALSSLRKALYLKNDEHEFHALRGHVLAALGRSKHATQSFERARKIEAAAALSAQARVEFDALALR